MNESLIKFHAMSYGPAAIGKTSSGKSIFVANAIVGESAQVQNIPTTREKSAVQWGEIQQLVESSPLRVSPACGSASGCECDYRHIAAHAQAEIKQAVFADQLQRIGNIQPAFASALTSPHTNSYRCQQTFLVQDDGNLMVESQLPGALPAFANCHSLHPTLVEVALALNFADFLPAENPPEAAQATEEDEALPPAPIRAVTIACTPDGASPMLLLHPAGENLPPLLVESELSVVVYRADGNLLTLAGDERLGWENAGNFWQVCPDNLFLQNPALREAICQAMLNWLGLTASSHLLCLTSEGGLLLPELARAAGKVSALESNPAHAADLVLNLENTDNVELYEAPFPDSLGYLAQQGTAVSHAIVQVRADFGEKTHLPALMALAPQKILLWGENPARLARIAKNLALNGWQASHAQLVDFLPNTHKFLGVIGLER